MVSVVHRNQSNWKFVTITRIPGNTQFLVTYTLTQQRQLILVSLPLTLQLDIEPI